MDSLQRKPDSSYTLIENSREKPTREDFDLIRFQVSGVDRMCGVYCPTHLGALEPRPLVLVLHGGGGNYRDFAKKTSWIQHSRKTGFVVAFLQAQELCLKSNGKRKTGNFWTTEAKKEQLCLGENYHNDSDYLDVVLAEIRGKYNIDSNRIYAAGFSNGMGYILQNVITRKPKVFAAVGGVGSMIYLPYKGSANMPVMMIIGQKDKRLAKYSNLNHFPMKDQYSIFHDETHRTCLNHLTTYLGVGRERYEWALDEHSLSIDFYPDASDSPSFLKYLMIRDLTHRFPHRSQFGYELDGATLLWNFFENKSLSL